MNKTLKQNILQWTPPELVRLLRHYSGHGVSFRGNFNTWEDACVRAKGYNDPYILDKIFKATQDVVEGKALFERDGVTFTEPEYPYSLLAGLLNIAIDKGGNLNVLDFGGALGSLYFQFRPWFANMNALHWCVVEQESVVKRGKEFFENDQLRFVYNLQESIERQIPDVVVLSGVLQYIDNPWLLIDNLSAIGISNIIIDRTPFVMNREKGGITLQVVGSKIMKCNYPVHIFCKKDFILYLEKSWQLFLEFPAADKPMGGIMNRIEYKGFIFKGKK